MKTISQKYQDLVFLCHNVNISIGGAKSNGGYMIAGDLVQIKAVELNCCTSSHILLIYAAYLLDKKKAGFM